MKASIAPQDQKERVLTKALLSMVDLYHLSGKDLSDITGISESSVTRLNQGKKFISPESKEGEIALLLLRIYRSLNALVGNNHAKANLWLKSFNHYFNHTPLDKMKTIPGLIEVLTYLDAMRGKL